MSGATGPKISWSAHLRVARHTGQHRRRVEESIAAGCRSSGQHGGAALDGVGDQGLNLPQPRLVDQRADLDAVFGAAPDGQGLHTRSQATTELVNDRGMHIDPVGRGARLAHVAHLGRDRPLDRLIEVGVLEHDERRVAAQLEGGPQNFLRALLEKQPADGGGTGEDNLRASPDRISGSITPPASVAVTQLTTPAGTPASVTMSISASIDSGVWAAGLITLVQPAAIAGPSLRAPIAIGKFQGVISRHGPTGCRATRKREPPAGAV